MSKTFRVIVVTLVIFALSATVAFAQDPTTEPSPLKPTPTPAPTVEPTDVPDLPPGLGGEDFDIVEWLTWLTGPGGGIFAFWLIEKSGLAAWLSRFNNPEITRLVALTISGLAGLAAVALLSAIATLPEGSVAVINALLAMVFSQLAHGRTLKALRPPDVTPSSSRC
jgi:hypothetical protein